MSDDGNRAVGRTTWAVPEGYIPLVGEESSEISKPDAACLLNTGDRDASVRITVYFPDRDPAGPYHVRVAARRVAHVRFKDLREPERIPRGTDYVSVIESDVPIVVRRSRGASRRADEALLSTIAHLQ
jgi:hypothetical protein